MRLARFQLANAVGRNVIDQRCRLWSGDVDLAHVADIEESDTIPDRHMLFHDAPVLYGHVPPAEIDELALGRKMDIEERRSLQVSYRSHEAEAKGVREISA
jgi:hypothetical protein